MWHPIETAPKDGTQILALYYGLMFGVETSMAVTWYDPEQDSWWAGLKHICNLRPKHVPTHWMLLPEPPMA